MKKLLIFALMFASVASVQGQNIFSDAKAMASSQEEGFEVSKAFDGVVSRNSCWKSSPTSRPDHIFEVSTPYYYHVDSLVIYTGIPLEEQTAVEKTHASGFSSMKNFKIQYWDDANWTDLPETVTTENRLERVAFRFSPAIRTFQFRIVCQDGEPVSINELEGYGKVDKSYAVQSAEYETSRSLDASKPTNIDVAIEPTVKGQSMEYVAYNQGYHDKGSNARTWIEYSGANCMRVWATLSSSIPESVIEPYADVETLEDFEARKNAIRSNPEGSDIKWDVISKIGRGEEGRARNSNFEFILKELQELGVDVLLQVNSKDFDGSWSNSFKQWQSYYAMAFYAAKLADVGMYATQNEPNHVHSGPMTIEEWVLAMRLVSDAVHCAIEDVNRLYNRDIEPRFVGPVTAGTNANWWSAIARAERVDYRGEKMDRDLIDLFSIHSYNSPAQGYATRVSDVNDLIKANHPEGLGKKIVFTETGRWMNAYLIDKEETMDSPSLFTEWAGMYTNNMLNGCFGMWAFKFSNTQDGTFLYGKKSGHHHTWKGQRFIEGEANNVALGAKVTASSGENCAAIVDGDKSTESAWVCNSSEPKWLEIELDKASDVGGIIMYSGSAGGEYTAPDRVRNFNFEALVDGEWRPIERTSVSANKFALVHYLFKPINTSKVRVNVLDEGSARIREIKLFTDVETDISYNVGGSQRTAQVLRLFAKGFKNQRDLYTIERSSEDNDLDIECCVDSETSRRYIWVVQRNVADYKVNLDLSKLGVKAGDKVVREVVSGERFGDADILSVNNSLALELDVPAQSVTLLTISENDSYSTYAAEAVALVRGGENASKNFKKDALRVELNSAEKSKNAVSYISFSQDFKSEEFNTVALTLNGKSSDSELFRFHIYAYGSDEPVDTKRLTWNSTQHLEANRAMVKDFDRDFHLAAEMSFDGDFSSRSVDVTKLIEGNDSKYINFILVREVREMGDDYDHGRWVELNPNKKNAPKLEVW
ncbi:MAG: discoidin domain-containing protein [Rikenellaceae bacterium]